MTGQLSSPSGSMWTWKSHKFMISMFLAFWMTHLYQKTLCRPITSSLVSSFGNMWDQRKRTESVFLLWKLELGQSLKIVRKRMSLRTVPTNGKYFLSDNDYVRQVDHVRGYWNPKRKLGVTMHFSEITALQYGEKRWIGIF